MRFVVLLQEDGEIVTGIKTKQFVIFSRFSVFLNIFSLLNVWLVGYYKKIIKGLLWNNCCGVER